MLRFAKSSSLTALWICANVLLVAFVAGGATCARRQAIPDFAPPVVFEQPPTLTELAEQINRSTKIQRLESNTLSISSRDIMASLSGTIAWERPHNFNLQAYPLTRMLGMAIAAGSNSEMFWLQRPSPPTLYYAKHDEFENQSGPRRMLPVSPLWLREALGVVELDPAMHHEGPITRPDGKLEIKTFIPSPRGAYQRIIVMDAKTGTIEQTILEDHTGKMIANAHQSEHTYYSAIDWNLPHKVDISLRPDVGPSLDFTVKVQFYLINEAPSDDPTAFMPPDATGLSTYNLVPQTAQAVETPTPPVYTQTPPTGQQSSLTNYRLR